MCVWYFIIQKGDMSEFFLRGCRFCRSGGEAGVVFWDKGWMQPQLPKKN